MVIQISILHRQYRHFQYFNCCWGVFAHELSKLLVTSLDYNESYTISSLLNYLYTNKYLPLMLSDSAGIFIAKANYITNSTASYK